MTEKRKWMSVALLVLLTTPLRKSLLLLIKVSSYYERLWTHSTHSRELTSNCKSTWYCRALTPALLTLSLSRQQRTVQNTLKLDDEIASVCGKRDSKSEFCFLSLPISSHLEIDVWRKYGLCVGGTWAGGWCSLAEGEAVVCSSLTVYSLQPSLAAWCLYCEAYKITII